MNTESEIAQIVRRNGARTVPGNNEPQPRTSLVNEVPFEIRGKSVRLFLAPVTMAVWTFVGILVWIIEPSIQGRIEVTMSTVLALIVLGWAWRHAATPNDFLTATTTVRLLSVVLGVITAYEMVSRMTGDSSPTLPDHVDQYVQGLFASLVSIVGFVLILLTDVARCFTIPLKRY